jgi:hypothetical protein
MTPPGRPGPPRTGRPVPSPSPDDASTPRTRGGAVTRRRHARRCCPSERRWTGNRSGRSLWGRGWTGPLRYTEIHDAAPVGLRPGAAGAVRRRGDVPIRPGAVSRIGHRGWAAHGKGTAHLGHAARVTGSVERAPQPGKVGGRAPRVSAATGSVAAGSTVAGPLGVTAGGLVMMCGSETDVGWPATLRASLGVAGSAVEAVAAGGRAMPANSATTSARRATLTPLRWVASRAPPMGAAPAAALPPMPVAPRLATDRLRTSHRVTERPRSAIARTSSSRPGPRGDSAGPEPPVQALIAHPLGDGCAKGGCR